jgi:hypothetical protein
LGTGKIVKKAIKNFLSQNKNLVKDSIEYIRKNQQWKVGSTFEASQELLEKMYEEYSPVFVLSTGRVGTKFLTVLLGRSHNIRSYHESVPRMELFCNDIYYGRSDLEKLSMVFNAARYDLILNAYISNKIYFESNHALTFFAYAIQKIYKKAKFIHIIRNPETFVRSALIKDWYERKGIWDAGRVKVKDQNIWNGMDQIEKISWLWNTTNQFIEEFKNDNLGKNNIFTIKLEELFCDLDKLTSLVKFVGAEKNDEEFIKKFMGRKIHSSSPRKERNENVKNFHYYIDDSRVKIKKYTHELARKYYDLEG